ncbi:MAG TPA: hypothetical protein DDY39_02735 [Nitrospira sp.]|nr:hypothetical protein [Nitrospira sp.]
MPYLFLINGLGSSYDLQLSNAMEDASLVLVILDSRNCLKLEELFKESIDGYCEVALGLNDITKWASSYW